MALTGIYSRNLDQKSRVAVPKPLRDAFASDAGTAVVRLYVAPGTDASLALYSESGFRNLADRFSQMPTSRAEIRNYLRMFYSRAEQIDVDSQGRIRLPERLVAFAKLERNVILAGVHDHAEIWNSKLWQQFESQHSAEFDRMASRVFE